MKRTMIYSIALLGLIAASISLFTFTRGRASKGDAQARPAAARDEFVVAAGRVEPASEEVAVGSEIGGKLRVVLVEEGDAVCAGQVLATLENEDYRAQVSSAEARLQQKEAELRLVINGARAQERSEAWESVTEAEAQLENARAEMERRGALFEKGVIAREESDRSEREYKVARARYDAARQRHALVDDDAREEDRSKAEADVALARAQLDEARARFEKTFIRSPINGIVLRKHMNGGEVVTDMREMPVVTVGDVAHLRVRADVDEADVGKLRLGQRAYVTADAYGQEKFWGSVIRVGQLLGKKNVRTDEPSERVDTKILETLVKLDDGRKLPAGLRVDTFIVVAETLPGDVLGKVNY